MHDASIVKISKDRFIGKDYFIGNGYSALINASIGTSSEGDTFDEEIKKAKVATSAGASIITDHSICGNVKEFHKLLRNSLNVPLCTVPIYELAIRNPLFSDKQAVELIEEQLDRGFNLLTLHATVNKQDVYEPISNQRVIPITSKGGRLMLKRMKATGDENPFYSRFDEILKVFKKYNAVISLGPTYRPASVVDNSMADDDPYWIETRRMAHLVKLAIDAEVPVVIEGIGHARISYIPTYVQNSKKICYGVPYRVLTVSTDIALGYDNISSSIASSIAVLNGANIVTAVTPSEHIGLPTVQQVEDGVVAAKIAIHSAELCNDDSIEMDRRMSNNRINKCSCQGNIDEAIFPAGALQALKNNLYNEGCTMCGEFCALKWEEKNES